MSLSGSARRERGAAADLKGGDPAARAQLGSQTLCLRGIITGEHKRARRDASFIKRAARRQHPL
ncbi:MAG TPA: hypothetical protein VJ456_17020, partial [Acidimicrobiia bacterium]|nr:hypothetical protein [Acidimicrobiia bacterium]